MAYSTYCQAHRRPWTPGQTSGLSEPGLLSTEAYKVMALFPQSKSTLSASAQINTQNPKLHKRFCNTSRQKNQQQGHLGASRPPATEMPERPASQCQAAPAADTSGPENPLFTVTAVYSHPCPSQSRVCVGGSRTRTVGPFGLSLCHPLGDSPRQHRSQPDRHSQTGDSSRVRG